MITKGIQQHQQSTTNNEINDDSNDNNNNNDKHNYTCISLLFIVIYGWWHDSYLRVTIFKWYLMPFTIYTNYYSSLPLWIILDILKAVLCGPQRDQRTAPGCGNLQIDQL